MEGKREDWGGEGRRGMVFASVKINSWYGPGLCMKAPSEEIYDKSTQETLKSTHRGLLRCRWQYGNSFV